MPTQPRIELLSARMTDDARVRLRLGTRVVEGHGPEDDSSLDAIAEATLEALAQLVPRAVRFRLKRLHLIDDDFPVAVAVITFSVGGVANAHVGSALVDGDRGLAVAKAVLVALNRRLEVLGL